MNGVLNWVEDKLMGPLGKMAQNIYLQSIRDAFVIFALPVILTGALFLIIANPPTTVNWGIIHAWENGIKPIQAQIMFPFNLTFGIMAVTVAFGVGYSLGERRGLDSVMSGILSMLAFFMTAFPVTDISKVPFGQILNYLGGQGLFVAIILGILTTEFMSFLISKGFAFEMPAGVPPYVMRVFRALVPFMLTLPIVWALEWIVWANFHITIPQAVLDLFSPLVSASNSYPAALGMIFLMLLLWSMGIHGMNVVSSVAYPFWMSQLAANTNAVAAGHVAHGIVTEPFFHMFAHIGGSGATFGLALFMLFSKSQQIKQVGKTAIVPTLFNINEPILFGLPIVLNPIMFIPFIIGPIIIVTINYILFATHLLPPVIIQPPFTVPIFLGGFIATGGHFFAGLMQVIDAAIAAVIYWPFFKKYEATLVEQEKKGAEQTASDTNSVTL
ncbi:PTS sugar transporter subunit IIC [Sporolactobacillus laevolacticus]|uniref:Permease IIC component n=1 Tax=Sporolactobacillus laevolacticus DSM 442 TaxID=1395513 RepID=V6IY71_9BACL|nr:PTS transporter subunit EIIC [Sporolactobacillus laevolacticus]EST12310.1 PTS cellobiose transporter subunit IIC [Sporolactobacillus laevolacticus DSM 442]MDN3955365.1 PTS transporter subunit EIIC [Sporolactobacillus laevolacticus]